MEKKFKTQALFKYVSILFISVLMLLIIVAISQNKIEKTVDNCNLNIQLEKV